MAFADVKEMGERWAKSPNIKFELINCDDEEKKMVFSTGEVSFYIVGPSEIPEDGNPDGEDNSKTSAASKTTPRQWHVWSDSDVVLTHLQEAIDFCDSCRKRQITEILTKVNKCLAPMLGRGRTNDLDEDEIEEDCEFDDGDDGFDDQGCDMDYYEQDDVDAANVEVAGAAAENNFGASGPYATQGNASAVQRLLSDMKSLQSSEGKFGVSGVPRDNNIFIWDVRLTDFPTKSQLGSDLKTYASKYNREPVLYLEMAFPELYPMEPPFVRVLRPRFKFLTGHVTIGGSICLEMLAKSGWRPSNDIESILVQIRAEIMSDANARLDMTQADRGYTEAEAKDAFHRMVQKYGWDK